MGFAYEPFLFICGAGFINALFAMSAGGPSCGCEPGGKRSLTFSHWPGKLLGLAASVAARLHANRSRSGTDAL
jgi:hypothetical protein